MQVSNRETLNALLYLATNGCVWRAPPARFGRWRTIDVQLLSEEWSAAALDSTVIKLHQHGAGAPRKRGPSDRALARRLDDQAAHRRPRRVHPADPLADARPGGRRARRPAAARPQLGSQPDGPALLIDRAYEGDATRRLAGSLGRLPGLAAGRAADPHPPRALAL